MAVQKRTTKAGKTRWVARYRDKAGREHSRSFDTQREAKAYLAEVEASAAKSTWVSPADKKLTVADMFERWIASEARRPSSRRGYSNTLRVNLHPIAEVKAVDLSPGDVVAWHTSLTTSRAWLDAPAPLSDSAARDAVRHLRTAFNWAVREGLVDRNPVRVPRSTATDTVDVELLPSPEDISAVIEAVRKGGATYLDTPRGPKKKQRVCTQGPHPVVADMLLVAWLTGMRVSEICGLLVREVDLERGVIHVRRQMDAEKPVRVELKTTRSRRDVPITDELLPTLLGHMLGKAPGDFLFLGAGGRPMRKSVVGGKVKRAAEHIGVEGVHFHALRHVFASNLLMAGVPVHVVADVLGHSRQMLLRVYAHALPGAEDAVRAAISSSCGIFAGSQPSGTSSGGV